MRLTWRAVLTAAGAVLAGVVTVGQAQVPETRPQQPVFHAGTDLVTLDVSVLDKNRQPVHGLTAKDFTVREDDRPQAIEAFSAVDIPDEAPVTGWVHEVGSDVVTNTVTTGRLLVLLMDDATLPPDPVMIAAAKTIGHSVVDRLGPSDELAVLFTNQGTSAEPFTHDRARLLAAVDRFNAGFAFSAQDPTVAATKLAPGFSSFTKPPDPEIRNYVSAVDALSQVAQSLISLPERRKSIVYVSVGIPIDESAEGPVSVGAASDIGTHEEMIDLTHRLSDTIRNAQRANVSIYGVSPAGTGSIEPFVTDWLVRQGASMDYAASTAHTQAKRGLDFLETTSDDTGGRATTSTNDYDSALTQIFRENGSYYLLGYRRASPLGPGHMSRVDVKVDQPGLEVRARNRNIGAPAEGAGAQPAPTVKAVAGLLPDPTSPLAVTAVPFAQPGQPTDLVAIALTAREPAPDAKSEEDVDLLTSAFTIDGKLGGSEEQHAHLTLRPRESADDVASYEVLTSIALKPGRYQLRLASHNVQRNESGSVFIDVDVPDFSVAPLSLSGLVLDVAPAVTAAPRDALASIIPVIPTTMRTFARVAEVTAFARAYQGAKTSPGAVTASVKIEDGKGSAVFESSRVLSARAFAANRSADVSFDLPTARLEPGPYLVTITISTGKNVAARAVRFEMR